MHDTRVIFVVRVVGVTVVARRVPLLLEAHAPRVRPVRRRRSPACRLVGDLCQEGGNLTLAGGEVVAGDAELGEPLNGADEGVVVIEVLGGGRTSLCRNMAAYTSSVTMDRIRPQSQP